jgi:hypothetical protein
MRPITFVPLAQAHKGAKRPKKRKRKRKTDEARPNGQERGVKFHFRRYIFFFCKTQNPTFSFSLSSVHSPHFIICFSLSSQFQGLFSDLYPIAASESCSALALCGSFADILKERGLIIYYFYC